MGNRPLQCPFLAMEYYHRIWAMSTKSYIIWYTAEKEVQDIGRSIKRGLKIGLGRPGEAGGSDAQKPVGSAHFRVHVFTNLTHASQLTNWKFWTIHPMMTCGIILAVSFIHRGGEIMSERERVRQSDYRDSMFRQAILAVYKLVDSVERLEDRLQDLEGRVDALKLGMNKEVEPILYS